MAKHPATIRALCRRLQQNDFQRSTNFTGPAPLYHPNGTVPFPLEILLPTYGTLLARTFAASFAALGSAKSVSGPKLRLALTANQTPAQLRRQPQQKAENSRPPPPTRLQLCAEEKLNPDWLLPVLISGWKAPSLTNDPLKAAVILNAISGTSGGNTPTGNSTNIPLSRFRIRSA